MNGPRPAEVAREFVGHFEARREGRLAVARCAACRTLAWPPRELCTVCQSAELTWEPAPSRGVVHTFSIARRAFHPTVTDDVPYGIVVVDVGDGVRFLGIYDGDLDELTCGLPVEAVLEPTNELVPSLRWRAVGGGADA